MRISESMPPADGAPADRQGVQVIARAAALLRALQHQADGMSLGELANVLDLPRSTVQRIVDALDREGLVVAASAVSGVRLGPALLTLAAATRNHIGEAARQTLRALARECGETVDLSLADHDKVLFIDQVTGTHRLTAVSSVGLSFPLHASANGKAVLAAMDDDQLERLRRRPALAALTPNTITDWVALDREIAAVRARGGVAFDREEHSIGICAVSLAIRGPAGELAALSIPVPTQRFNASETALADALVRHAQRLQMKLDRRG